ncbi:Crp/Fnr family transcriptional regulator [Georgenia sp. Z1344]|uniref:Crp/Fnr family transcriptional regulator n=1 Tax=Georgenia sp. Z1344 TaxID=3416706 RepID=UPI003CF98383
MTERRHTPLTEPVIDPHACTPQLRLAVLGRDPLFTGLPPAELAAVDTHFRARHYAAGEPIYHSGDPADRLFIPAAGLSRVSRTAIDGRETLLGLHGPGESFGALPSLGVGTYPDDARALTFTCLLHVSSEQFAALVDELPRVAVAALHRIGQRLAEAHESVHLLSGAPLEQRLAAALLVLAEKIGEPWEGMTLLQAPLGREDLAALTGSATESVSRLLSRWRRDGLVESGRRWVALADIDRLAAVRDAA